LGRCLKRLFFAFWGAIIKQGEPFMKIIDAQNQIAEKLSSDEAWADILCNDCLPGIYKVFL